MTISNSYGAFNYPVNQLIEDAALDAGIPSSLLTADILLRAMRALNLMLTSMPNLRIYTWQQKQILIPLYENQAAVVAPAGTFNLLDRNFRQPTRLSGTLSSSDGGVVRFADDDDFETRLVQVAPLGNVQIELASATQLYELGVLWGATASVSYVTESSDDTVTWRQIDDEVVVDAVDRQWTWVALDGAVPALYWRLRMTSGTLDAREVYFGGMYTDITLAKLTRNQYMTMPTKAQPGRPLQAWLDRQRDQTILRVWQVPQRQYRYCHIAAIQQKMLADVTSLRQTLDVPLRWLDMMRSQLAVRICRTFPEAKLERLKVCQEQAAEAYMPAQSEDRDDSPITIFPQIAGYT